MPQIIIHTEITAPINICFDLARNIDIHKESLSHTGEIPISGKTTGLIENGEWVTWEAKHFGFVQHLTTRVTDLEYPSYFDLEMVLGIFKSYRHVHVFIEAEGKTTMVDRLAFESPYGILGKLVNSLFLEKYIVKMLKTRNAFIKKKAEYIFLKHLENAKDKPVFGELMQL